MDKGGLSMAWLEKRRRKDGSIHYWVRDRRDGRQIVIYAGESVREGEMKLEQYVIRRDLEKEGYNDGYERIADDLFGPKKVSRGMA
jgi:hypothetical protein